jgi:hypothetical protein
VVGEEDQIALMTAALHGPTTPREDAKTRRLEDCKTQKQVQSYLRTLSLPIGLLMNFNALLLKDGLQRIILQQPVVRAERD